MAKLKLIIQILFVIAVFLIGMLFILRNDAPVTVDLIAIQVDFLHIGWWIILSFITGGILGLLVLIPSVIGRGALIRSYQKKLERQDEALLRSKGYA